MCILMSRMKTYTLFLQEGKSNLLGLCVKDKEVSKVYLQQILVFYDLSYSRYFILKS